MTLLATIRDAHDDDALDVIELIGSVFGEYVGCVMDVDGEMPELRRVASAFAEQGGRFWVAENAGRIVRKCVGYARHGDGIELKKLYVHRRERKTGLGAALVDRVEAEALALRATSIDLWSDTRFTTARAFYEKRGYVRGPQRELGDLSKSFEHYFVKHLSL